MPDAKLNMMIKRNNSKQCKCMFMSETPPFPVSSYGIHSGLQAMDENDFDDYDIFNITIKVFH
jgi:hypothetical protein